MKVQTIDELLEKLGTWGKFQIVYYACLCFTIVYTVCPMSYIFTTRDIKYRCSISECEGNETVYNPEWLKDFVPYKDNIPNRCLRYASRNDTCTPEGINKNKTVVCQSFVYERPETTIVHDFGITCDSNLWKLTIVGTINVVGELICLSYSGYLSDKFGRARIMIISVLLSCFIGTLKSFSFHYFMFLFLEFLETALCSATYSAAFILAMEIVPHDQRTVGNTVISCAFSLGQMMLGLVAWSTASWRTMLRTIYIPGLVAFLFFHTVPESIRWSICHDRQTEAKNTILRVARTNGRVLEDETIEKLFDKIRKEEWIKARKAFRKAVFNKVLYMRVVICSFLWMCCVFVYYGLTIHSVNVSDNVYLSFVFTVAVEIPGYLIYYLVNERVGRRTMMLITLMLGGAVLYLIEFLPQDYFWYKLTCFLAGKCCVTIAYTVLYVYTTEMFPTCTRHFMFSICSMWGRFGALAAPQVPLMARYSQPILMFGILSGMSGCLALFLPETLNTKLPDTVDDAINIGKNRKRCHTEAGDKLNDVGIQNFKGEGIN